MSNGSVLQETFLKALVENNIAVSVYLINGIKLQGKISDFDQGVIMLKSGITQMIYKNSISTVVPMGDVATN